MIEVQNLSFSYDNDIENKKVLKDINVKFENGKVYAILGESGSGKTTFLSLLAGLENLKEGEILIDGKDIRKIGYTKFRKNYSNVIFQSYNLINYLSGIDNVLIGMNISNIKVKDKKKYAYEFLDKLKIDKQTADRPVLRISGGQQQRITIARALATDAKIIFADEPTGNLDSKTEANIINIFKEIAHKENRCVIIVTHSRNIAKNSDVVYEIKDGKIDVV